MTLCGLHLFETETEMETFDVAIVGGGPAGSSCAAFCALAGLRTLVLEREKFPREKVCGDCLNPSCWPVLDRLDLAQHVRALPHAKLDFVEFIAVGSRKVIVDLPSGDECEFAVKRSVFDDLLLRRAGELGASIYEETTVTALTNSHGWKVETTTGESFVARTLVGADGRNSTVARLCNLLPRAERERIALQSHLPLPGNFGKSAVLQFLPSGYSRLANHHTAYSGGAFAGARKFVVYRRRRPRGGAVYWRGNLLCSSVRRTGGAGNHQDNSRRRSTINFA